VSGTYLFSIDLEDVRTQVKHGMSFKPRVPENVDVYLRFLSDNKSRCTFFVVGDMMRMYPELIQIIAAQGHEIACHSDTHIQLDLLGPEGFRKDIEAWKRTADDLGIDNVKGFRAPTFSLTAQSTWAYPILRDLGFTYSSSVLPAGNPLYGWPGFGSAPKMVDGIMEIPMNLSAIGPLKVPFGGGVYFRLLPWSVLKQLFLRSKRKGEAVLGYFHPYDVDTEQERFMHPGLGDSRFYNALMYQGRAGVMDKLHQAIDLGFTIERYDAFALQLNGTNDRR